MSHTKSLFVRLYFHIYSSIIRSLILNLLSIVVMALSSLSRSWEHDVFPSFHGKDVRQTFLSHVLKEFNRKGINFFIDNEIKRGEFIGPELKRAIKGSKIAIVLLSKNYASSSWCLDELVEIMMKKESSQTVITIFYDVDPTDVKKQKGDFGKVFKKTCKGKGKEKVQTWKKALEGVATIAGYHSSNWVDEATMVEKLAADISNKLNHLTPSRDFDDRLIGMGAHMEMMKPLLRLELDEVRMIGIWGPPGLGKTTIARFLFNQVSSRFQNSAFMVNIRGSYPRPCLDEYSAQLQLQKEMLSEMINQKDIIISHLGVVQGRLGDRKVLLVLDDVDRLAQLEALAKNVQWFGRGSRIIITTEDLRLLKAHRINHIYKVNFPSTDEALQMFCMYAFDQKSPKDGFDVLAREITYLVGELPLALKVMGSYFRGLSKHQWSMEVSRLRTNLNGDIESILKFSFDALCDEDKDLFLHIANYFANEFMDRVEEYLAESFKNVRQRLHVLAEKSLISIDHARIWMHNLLVQLGKEIVRNQSVYEPGQRQFLVDEKDICEILTDYTTITRSVIGLKYEYKLNIKITDEVFEKLPSLQFLRLGSFRCPPNIISSPGRLNYISPKLRVLHWYSSSMTCLPFTNNLEFLVELSMYNSKLEKLWDGIKLLRNLKWMDLSDSTNLKELPNLSMATSLKKLGLCGCSSLVELPFSIGNATNLEDLNLSECSSLVELPSSIGNLQNLGTLYLDGCSKLKALPINISMESLHSLDLSDCWSFKSFPEISTNIIYLNLIGTPIKEVPSSITSWSRLNDFRMSYSENLKEFPYVHHIITELHLSDTGIHELGPWLRGFSSLSILVVKGMQKLVSLPHLPDSLRSLDAGNCVSLEKLDCSFCNPDIYLNLVNCFKLNKDARDLIIQSSTHGRVVLPGKEVPTCSTYRTSGRSSTHGRVVLPGKEVPACFTYRASGNSVTVKLKQKPLRTSAKFTGCFLFVNKSENEACEWEHMGLSWGWSTITSKEDVLAARGSCGRDRYQMLTEHLYIFDFVAEGVTSTELVFNFGLTKFNCKDWEIKECGIIQLLEHHVDGNEEMCERRSDQL